MKMTIAGKNNLFLMLEGIAAAIVLNLFIPFVQMFARRMGAGDMHIALLNSLPPLVAMMVLIPGGLFISRAWDKKRLACGFIGMYSFFFLAVALVPFLPESLRVTVFVLLIGFMNLPGALYTSSWQTFFSESFSGGNANVLFTTRSRYASLFGLVTVLFTGLVLTGAVKDEQQRIVMYQLVYVVCFVVTLLQGFFLRAIQPFNREPSENRVQKSKNRGLEKGALKAVFTDKTFMLFCITAFIFYFSWQMGWPLFFIYNVDCIKVNELQLAAISVAAGLSSFLSYFMWHRSMKKVSGSFLIIFSALGLAMNPLFYTGNVSYSVVILINLFVGAAAAGLNLFLFCNLMEILKEDKKALYISVFNTLQNISGFVAPLVGISLYRQVGIYQAMLFIGLIRIFGVLLLTLRWLIWRKQ